MYCAQSSFSLRHGKSNVLSSILSLYIFTILGSTKFFGLFYSQCVFTSNLIKTYVWGGGRGSCGVLHNLLCNFGWTERLCSLFCVHWKARFDSAKVKP